MPVAAMRAGSSQHPGIRRTARRVRWALPHAAPTARMGVGAGKGCSVTERDQAPSGTGRTGRARRQPAASPSTGSATVGPGATAASAASAGASATAFGGASGAGGDVGGQAATAPEPVEQLQAQAGQLVDLARDQLTGQLATQKARAADGLSALAATVRQVGQQTRQQDPGPLADYVDGAADQLAQLATTLREQDIDQLGATVSGFARRQPALFLAAAVGLGFAGVRFLKSSAPASTGRSSSGFADRATTGTTFSRGDVLGSDRWASASRPTAAGGRGGDARAAFGGTGHMGTGSAGSGFEDLGDDATRSDAGAARSAGGFGAEDR
jgi:hypothetical protein